MLVFKRKQIVALLLVLMVIVAGYLQYGYKDSGVLVGVRDNSKIGESVYVNAKKLKDERLGISKKQGSMEVNKELKIECSKQADDFFPQAKLDREKTRSKSKETLNQISQDTSIPQKQREDAYNKAMSIAFNTEKEMKIETLIKEKGFDDVVALIGTDGSVDIVVKAPTLSEQDVSQMVDITTRHANVSVEGIHVKNIY